MSGRNLLLCLLGIGLAAGSTPVASQAAGVPVGVATAYLPSAGTDSMLVLVEMRDPSAIEADIQSAAEHGATAKGREAQARMLQSRAATTIKIKESEINSLEAQVNQAKVEKNDLRRRELDDQRKFAEIEKTLLKRREDLRQSEIDYARAEIEYHATTQRAFEAELELAHMRARRLTLEGSISSREMFDEAQKLWNEIRETERRTLDARLAAAEKLKKLAEQAVAVTRAQLEVYDAQRKVLAGTYVAN
jgi:hypothetical protein